VVAQSPRTGGKDFWQHYRRLLQAVEESLLEEG